MADVAAPPRLGRFTTESERSYDLRCTDCGSDEVTFRHFLNDNGTAEICYKCEFCGEIWWVLG